MRGGEGAVNLTCDNCEEQLTGEPFYFDGNVYCCAGCAGGGPCTCTYQPPTEGEADTDADRSASSETLEPLEPPTPDAPDAADAHEEILEQTLEQAEAQAEAPLVAAPPAAPLAAVYQEVTRRPAVLRMGGFARQLELLQFALELERQPTVDDVALVRSDLADAWFEVRVENAEQLQAALGALASFAVTVEPAALTVDATVRALAPSGEAAELSDLLPPRQRFRLFRSAEEPPTTAPLAGTPLAEGPAAEPVGEAPALAGPLPAQAAGTAGSTVLIAPPAGGPVAADARPGGAAPLREHVTLVVYPFHSFVALNHFQEAVRALHGIIDAKVRRFYKGTLHLSVDYEDVIPLAERLDDLEGFPRQMVSESANEIELLLLEEAALEPAESV